MLSLITLTGCNKKLVTEDKIEYTKKDSIVYNINYKDTVIYIPSQVAIIDGLRITVDTAGKAQLAPTTIKNKKASVTVSIKDSQLKASGGCAEDSLRLVLEEKEKKIYSLERYKSQKTEVKLVKYTPQFIQYLAIFGAVALAFFIYKIMKIISL